MYECGRIIIDIFLLLQPQDVLREHAIGQDTVCRLDLFSTERVAKDGHIEVFTFAALEHFREVRGAHDFTAVRLEQ